MDTIELTKLFVEYRETADKLAVLEKQIQEEVLALGESQKVAGVKATYYKPSVEIDYEAAVNKWGIDQQTITDFSTIKRITRWKEIAEYLGNDLTPFTTEKPARVVVKI